MRKMEDIKPILVYHERTEFLKLFFFYDSEMHIVLKSKTITFIEKKIRTTCQLHDRYKTKQVLF